MNTYAFLVWSITIKDIPWRHIDTQPHDYPVQAFAEIIGKKNDEKDNEGSFFFLVPYNPFFYVSLPYEWSKEQCSKWVSDIKKSVHQPWFKHIELLWRNRQPIHTSIPTKTCTVIKFTFPTLQFMKAFGKHLLDIDPTLVSKLWESPRTVPDTLKVSMISHVKPCKWIQVPIDKCSCMALTFTKHCDEWFVPSLDAFQPWNNNENANLCIVSFDLEMYSVTGKFPMAERNDPIITIGNSILTTKDNKIRNLMYCLNEVERDPNWRPSVPEDDIAMEIKWFATEKDLLIQWRRDIFDTLDPDIVTGYNIYQFDLPYLAKRAKILGVPNEFYSFGRKLNDVSKFQLPSEEELRRRKEQQKHKQHKLMIQCPLHMYGRVVLDMMLWVQKLPDKFKAYKLDTVAEALLGKHKVDLKPSEIFAKFRGTKYDRYELTRYCAVDCILVLDIMVNQNVTTREMAMARHTCTDIVRVVSCGQQLKCFNMILCFGYAKKYICNYTAPSKSADKWVNNIYNSFDDRDMEEREKYEGATVIEPKVGYYRQPIIVVDFASKYPTEMRSHNLCSSTFIGDESMALTFEPWLANRPKERWASNETVQFDSSAFRTFWKLNQDKEYTNDIKDEWHDIRPTIQKVVNGSHEWSYFVTHFTSLVGEIITYLMTERSKLKKQMKAAKQQNNKLAESIANADQLAIKIVMNSLYGMYGADPDTGRLPCKCVAKSVTSVGREEIEISKQTVEKIFQCVVTGGDTDSLFLRTEEFKSQSVEVDVRMAFELGDKIATYITNTVFQRKAELQLEKVYYPFMVPMKKKYSGAKYEVEKDANGQFVVRKPKLDATGSITNKREFCDVHKEIFDTMMTYMIMENNPKKAYMFLLFSLERMANNWYSLDKFVCRNKLSDKDNTNIKAVVIRDKIRARMPGSEPRPRDMVPFVYVRIDTKDAKVLERIEDPEFVAQNGLVLDLAHYIQLFQAQIEPYFVRFPSLQVGKLFEKAILLSKSYGSSQSMTSFFVSTPQPSQFSKFMEQLLRLHLQQLAYKHAEEIIHIWTTHFVWRAIPSSFHHVNITLDMLWTELDREMANAVTKRKLGSVFCSSSTTVSEPRASNSKKCKNTDQ